ncbi:MAG: hypothetical protein R2881_01545 [Eubacteriales bacterium]
MVKNISIVSYAISGIGARPQKVTGYMDHTFRNKTISGVIWKVLENGGNRGIRLVISVILARMLDPENCNACALAHLRHVCGHLCPAWFCYGADPEKGCGQRRFLQRALVDACDGGRALYAAVFQCAIHLGLF